VAAQLQKEPDVEITLVKGGFGEFSVSVDGLSCFNSKRFLYPRPSRVVERVRAFLAD
jgi:hypothetical protein